EASGRFRLREHFAVSKYFALGKHFALGQFRSTNTLVEVALRVSSRSGILKIHHCVAALRIATPLWEHNLKNCKEPRQSRRPNDFYFWPSHSRGFQSGPFQSSPFHSWPFRSWQCLVRATTASLLAA